MVPPEGPDPERRPSQSSSQLPSTARQIAVGRQLAPQHDGAHPAALSGMVQVHYHLLGEDWPVELQGPDAAALREGEPRALDDRKQGVRLRGGCGGGDEHLVREVEDDCAVGEQVSHANTPDGLAVARRRIRRLEDDDIVGVQRPFKPDRDEMGGCGGGAVRRLRGLILQKATARRGSFDSLGNGCHQWRTHTDHVANETVNSDARTVSEH